MRTATLIGLALLLSTPATSLAQVPPGAEWRTVVTEHFRVTFPAGLESLAGHATERLETTHARLSAEFGRAPRGPIEVLLTDFVDQSNGTATPFPGNRIVLYARPPTDHLSLGNFEDWLDILIVHELTHIFHLDVSGRLGSLVRGVFGRIPAPWPIFPAVMTPTWSIEGLATFVESDHTGAGRVHGSYHEMVLRTAVLGSAFDSIDRVSGTGPVWPGGSRAYIYGSLFADFIREVYGPDAHRKLIEATASAAVPPFLAFDRVASHALGKPFTELFDEWRDTLEARYAEVARAVRADGLTETERLTRAGYLVAHPRVAPDGRVAYAAYDARSTMATRVIDPATGAESVLARRNAITPIAWLPDGSILTTQPEFDGPYRIVSDLYRVDARGERRLTSGARLGEADVALDGRTVVAVQYTGGTNRLVVHDLETGQIRALTEARPNVHWSLPRWSPDGRRIAVARWLDGENGIVVLDREGRVTHRLSRGRGMDLAPTWSPDGRFVLFSSDRDGITNLYAVDLEVLEGGDDADALWQVTNLLTGAFYPEVSPDGRWIYFAAYDVDGFHLERMAFDPRDWRTPRPTTAQRGAIAGVAAGGTAAATESVASGPTTATESVAAASASPYSALWSMRPRYWLPAIEGGSETTGIFYGAMTSGTDLVGRHTYSAIASIEPKRGLFRGALAYDYAGWENPVLGLEFSRDWEHVDLGTRPEGAPDARLLIREDGIAATVTFLRQRWRSAARLTVGAERVAETRHLFDAPGYQPGYPGTVLAGWLASGAYARYQQHPFSISREDGVAFNATARGRYDLEPFTGEDGSTIDRGSIELLSQATAYRAVRRGRFANHVLAARFASLRRDGPGANTVAIGGASPSVSTALGHSLGTGNFLPVRGFEQGHLRGTRAWAASLEYRMPVAIINRGVGLWPIYFDRLSASAFVDAGAAWCGQGQVRDGLFCAASSTRPIASAGFEAALDVTVFYSGGARIRPGIAFPLRDDRGEGPSFYLLIAPSF